MELTLHVTVATDVGCEREHNEDAAALAGTVIQHDHGAPQTWNLTVEQPLRIVVCDGMGGHLGGETASQIAACELSKPGDDVAADIQRVSDDLNRLGQARPELRGLGTTAVVVEVRPDGTASIFHVGDSRAYLADPELSALTVDDRVAANLPVLTQALGPMDKPLDVHCYDLDLLAGQRLLLCSDGLVDVVSDTDIECLLEGDDASTRLVTAALKGGAPDNVTVAVIDVVTSPKRRLSPAEVSL